MKWNGGVLALFLSTLLFVTTNTGVEAAESPRTIFVDASKGANSSGCFNKGMPCKNVQFALDIAATGDVICLSPGSYREDVRIQKEVSFCGSGRISSVVLLLGARIPETAEVTADKVQVMFGARLQDGIDLVTSRGMVSLAVGTYESVSITKSLTILGAQGELSAVNGCPQTVGGSVLDAAGSPFGIVQSGPYDLTVRDLNVRGVSEAAILANSPRKLVLERVYAISPDGGGTGVYILNASGGLLTEGSVCGSKMSAQGIVLSGSTGVRVREYGVWRQRIGIGVVGYKEQGDSPRQARGNLIEDNFIIFNEVGVRVEGNSRSTSVLGNVIVGNDVGVQSVALNRDGFEHSAPANTILRSNAIFGNEVNVESFVLGNGSSNIKAEAVDARQNWWGTFTGPQESQSNPRGVGSTVSSPVRFGPWCADPACEDEFSVAERLVFISESKSPSSSSFNLVVEARDSEGNLAVNFDGEVRLSWSVGCGTLFGNKKVRAVDGQAVFTNLSLQGLQNGCLLTASSSGLKEASSKGVFSPVLAGDPSSITPPPSVPTVPVQVSEPVVLDFDIPKPNGVTSFTTSGNWETSELVAKLKASGCSVASLLRFRDGKLRDYIDQLSGRIDPSFPTVLSKGTLMIVWCK